MSSKIHTDLSVDMSEPRKDDANPIPSKKNSSPNEEASSPAKARAERKAAIVKEKAAANNAWRASTFRKTFRIFCLLGYFSLSLFSLKVMESWNTDEIDAVLTLTEPIRIESRDCEISFIQTPPSSVHPSSLTASVTMANNIDSVLIISGNNITALSSPTAGTKCTITLQVPPSTLLPSLTIAAWRHISTVSGSPCEFPFTVTGDPTFGNKTFYDCTNRKQGTEGGVTSDGRNNDTTLNDNGYGPESPWCSLTPFLTIEDIEDEDAEEVRWETSKDGKRRGMVHEVITMESFREPSCANSPALATATTLYRRSCSAR